MRRLPRVHRFMARCGAGLVLALLLAAAATASGRAAAQGPLYITPNVEGLLLCDEALESGQVHGFADAEAYCIGRGLTGAKPLVRLMETLEPGGPQGRVRVGYTLTIPLLTLFKPSADGQWRIDEKRVEANMRLIEQVDRPVVVYFSATHFDTTGALTKALLRNPDNLLKLPDGKPPQLDYFGYGIAPFTLRVDEDIPVNRYRFEALRYMARRIEALPEAARGRIVAITLAGEVHQLFPDFEHGTGNYTDIQVTDYDPASVADFRQWLAQKYRTVDALKRQTGLSYDSFEAIDAPRKNIRRERLGHFGEHYDAYAHGTVPVAGWLWDPQQRVQALLLYVNGRLLTPIERDFNRLDVYRAREDITSPNVGFRHDLDFSAMPAGRHRLQVVARTADGRQHLLGERVLVVVSREQSSVSKHLPDGTQDLVGLKDAGWRRLLPSLLERLLVRMGWLTPLLPSADLGDDVHWWLDKPEGMLDVYYNPLAREWNAFRASQSHGFLAHFHTQALAAGLPADLLYSHQIIPRVNSSWNPQLFAIDGTLGGDLPWKPGFNLYGGATQGPWLQRFLASNGITDYGVPEFNPQQWKRPDTHVSALRAHYDANARFVSPMYITLVPQRFLPPGETSLTKLSVSPGNPAEGSAAFYEAIRTLARE